MNGVAQFLHKELTVDAALTTGMFYYLRSEVSEKVGALFLITYGLIRTGTDRVIHGDIARGTALVGLGIALAIHIVAIEILNEVLTTV